MNENTQKIYDCIVIGGGPGGVSAAVYAVRGGSSVAIVHNGASALHRAERIQNYYGVGEVSGAELYRNGLEHAAALGAEVIDGEVTFVRELDGLFTVVSTAGEFVGRRAVIAVGASRVRANIPGLTELDGKGVSYCAVCDAFFYRKKRVGVVGAGEFAEHEYNALSGVVGEVVLLTDGETPTFTAQKVCTQKISRVIERDGRCGGVMFADGTSLELDGLFVALGTMGSGALAKSLGVFTDERGSIKTDSHGMTNIAGLYAAGDCTSGVKQIAKAVADGMNVGMSLIADIKRSGR